MLMCFGMFGMGECCEPVSKAGFRDLYCTTCVFERQSTIYRFSRTCSNNTLTNADNGAAIEPTSSYTRNLASGDAHREILISNAGWGGSVFQLERCQPIFYDDFTATNSVAPGPFASITSRDPIIFPLVDSSGKGWSVDKTWSSADPQNLASFDLQRADFVANAVFQSGGGTAGGTPATSSEWGLAFRIVDKDNYLLAAVAGSPAMLTLRLVQNGASIILATASGAGFPIAVTTNGNQVSISSLGAAIGPLTVGTFSTATRVGIWRKSLGSDGSGIAPVTITAQAAAKKYFLSNYGTAPTLIAEFRDDATYSVASLLGSSGDSGMWLPQPGVFNSNTLPPYVLAAGPVSLATSSSLPLDPAAEVFPIHVVRGQQLTKYDKLTYPRANLTWTDANGLTHTFTRQGLGYDAAPCFAKHACDKGAGYKIRSTSIAVEDYSGTPQDICTTVNAVVIGSASLADATSVPSVAEEMEVYSFVSKIPLSDEDPFPEDWRRANVSMNVGFGRTIGGGIAASYTNAVKFFEATPNLDAWAVHAVFKHGAGLSPFSQPLFYDYGEVYLVGGHGWKVQLPQAFTSAAVSPGRVAVITFTPFTSTPYTLTIYAGGGVVFQRSFATNIGTPALLCASDRFFYLAANLSASDAQSFSTAPAAFLGSGNWMVSIDGTYRFPCVAVPRVGGQANSYVSRVEAEAALPGHGFHLFDGADVDCIKTSDGLAPPLANPVF